MKIGTRLWFSFTAMFVIMVAIVVTAMMQMDVMDAASKNVNRSSVNIQHALEVDDAINAMRRFQLNALVIADGERLKELERVAATGDAAVKKSAELEKFQRSADSKKLTADLRALLDKYVKGNDEAMRMVKEGKSLDLVKDLVQGDLRKAQRAAGVVTQEFIKLQESRKEVRLKEAETAMAQAQKTMYTLLAAALIAAIVIAILITRSITRPMALAVTAVERVADGDLTREIASGRTDETGQLLAAVKRMQQGLRGTVGKIKGASDTVGNAAREISQGNSDLSSRTEEQASALEETAASMEEMTATVSQNAENARNANKLAADASITAVRGGQAVRDVVGTMSGISDSSKKIGDIIGVIDGIAFQTNILALNAAVEAARAGEQGRGFAVVASEVRSLAQRSAAAAKEIKQLIGDSVAKVDAGSKQVEAAGKTVDEIVDSVKKVSALVAEIAAASQEQAQGIEQVSETVTQLEKVTQQNAAMVEQASAASASMEEQAVQLVQVVSAFTLDGRGQSAAPAASATPVHRSRAAQANPKRTAAGTDTALTKAHGSGNLAKLPSRAGGGAKGGGKGDGWEEF